MKSKLKTASSLFFILMKIGLFTFGGGYAMISLLENEFVSKRKWIDKDEFLDLVAIAESTPGPIAINAATYIGYKQAGILGSVFATVGVCIPSFVIIYLISVFLDTFLSFKYVAYAFKGIQACVIYLIFSAGMKMLKGLKKTPFNCIILCAVVLCTAIFSLLSVNFSTVFYILICGGIGLFAYTVKKIREKGGKA